MSGLSSRRRQQGLGALLLVLAALGCAPGLRPLADSDTIAGARAADTSFRVKDRFAVPGRKGREYLPPIGEYWSHGCDEDGIYYAAPGGLLERAGFARSNVPGGIFVARAGEKPFVRPQLYVEGRRGRPVRLPLPEALLAGYGRLFAFAVGGEELPP